MNIHSVVQIGAPANDLNGERRDGEKEAVFNKNVPQIDASVANVAEQNVPGGGAAANSAVEGANDKEKNPSEKQSVLDENVPQIDAPGGGRGNGVEQGVWANDIDGADANLVMKEERAREPSGKDKGLGVGAGDAEVLKRKEQKGVASVNRNELRKRSDDEQLVGEREKANVRGDRKGGQLHAQQQQQQQREVRGAPEEQDGRDVKKEEAVKDRDKRQTIDKKTEFGRENVPNTGRRKMNQVVMLKARDPDKPAILVGDRNNEKPLAGEEKKENVVERKVKDELRHDSIRNPVQMDPRVNSKAKVAQNATNKRPLIEKVSQLQMTKRAGYGRLKDMPFMKARRFVQQQEEKMKADAKPPKFNQRKIDDLLKYSDKLNFFEEFCKEVAEPLVECGERRPRELTEAEKAGQNIMFTLRTTLDYHDERLPVLFETWLSTVDPRTVFLVTDGEDAELDDITENIGEGMCNDDDVIKRYCSIIMFHRTVLALQASIICSLWTFL